MLSCYFGPAEPICRGNSSSSNLSILDQMTNGKDMVEAIQTFSNVSATYARFDPANTDTFCQRVKEIGASEFRAASMEYLFHHVSDLVIAEAQQQIGLVFNAPHAPPKLIMAHIRWGDKIGEMRLVHIQHYVNAIQQLAMSMSQGTCPKPYYSDDHSDLMHINDTNMTLDVNVYVATEDPNATIAFQQAAPSHWKIYYDRTVEEMSHVRPNDGNHAVLMSEGTQGRSGLLAMGSLLVALEANGFVFTTRSNWSRLINELRKNVIDPQCGNCTCMIDLRPGEY
jgi:hypothetical protein